MSDDTSDNAPTLPPPPRSTVIEVVYPSGLGAIGLRGDLAPLSWEHTEPPFAVEGDRHLFRVPIPPDGVLELKVVRGDDEWAAGRNYTVHAGDDLRIEPYFEASAPTLEETQTVGEGEGAVRFDVLLPPSYGEQPGKRYPTLYVLDGQSLWSHSQDPFGVWGLEQVLGSMFELGAIEDVIVIGVHTAEQRMERLSPVADPDHGGGGAPAFLGTLVDVVKKHIDERYRTIPGADGTAILGSSMGGLFAFFAAWTRPDVFGKAACLSSSFWWANRYAVRLVQQQDAPEPRPTLYLDSGAAPNPMERDANVRDGFNHTRAMLRALAAKGYTGGRDVHRLVFPGQTHDAPSWASRVALPLQLLFPPQAKTVSEDILAKAAE